MQQLGFRPLPSSSGSISLEKKKGARRGPRALARPPLPACPPSFFNKGRHMSSGAPWPFLCPGTASFAEPTAPMVVRLRLNATTGGRCSVRNNDDES